MKDHHASDAGAVTREKQFKGRRDAKKKAYAADAPARNARAEARAAEERARAEARAAEKQARAEAHAAEAKARAAEKQARAALPRTLHGVEVVPPEEGATTGFVGVSWDISKQIWKACYKRGKGRLRGPNYGHVPGTYPTNQRAARARHKHICDEGLEQFNEMDALDDATDLMVPREKKPPKKRPLEPVAAAPTRQSSRARKVSHAAEASAEQENMRF